MNVLIISLTVMVIFVGAALAFQAPINAVLANNIGDPVWAAATSFGVGFALLTFIALMRGSAPDLTQFQNVPWWALTGGVLGAAWVLAALWSVSTLGALTMFSAMILGQMLAALAIDATGVMGLTVRDISLTRIAAIICVAIGVILSFR